MPPLISSLTTRLALAEAVAQHGAPRVVLVAPSTLRTRLAVDERERGRPWSGRRCLLTWGCLTLLARAIRGKRLVR